MSESELESGPSSPQEKSPVTESEKPAWGQEELLQIFDQILFENEYREDITIKGRLRVTFRTRSAEETVAVSKFIDSSDFKLISTVEEHRAIKNLGYSLVVFQGKDLSRLKEEEKSKFISQLPTQVIGMLVDKLAEFDRKVAAACSEAERNF